jgi:hypothetical protein
MTKRTFLTTTLMGALALGPVTGCESLPGNDEQQGAVIGGVGGALAGAALSKDNRALGALIGGALGAGGGYLIGANKDKITGKDKEKSREEAIRASERAEREPARAEDVDRARTADLNDDGFVTLDEVVAMEQANLSDRDMLDRLQSTDQVFELTEYQENYLRDRGVSAEVIRSMRTMNQDYAETASADADRDRDEVFGDGRVTTDREADRDNVRDRDSQFD